MSSTRKSGTENSISLASTITIATKLLLVSALAVVAFCVFAIPSHAQGSLSLGTLTTNGNPSSCNNGDGWYYFNNNFAIVAMNCQAATVSNCSNLGVTTSPWAVTIGYPGTGW